MNEKQKQLEQLESLALAELKRRFFQWISEPPRFMNWPFG